MRAFGGLGMVPVLALGLALAGCHAVLDPDRFVASGATQDAGVDAGACATHPGAMCCYQDTHCDLGLCRNVRGCTRELAGICLPSPALPGRCFDDRDCPTGLRCEGASFCNCGQTGCMPATGNCR